MIIFEKVVCSYGRFVLGEPLEFLCGGELASEFNPQKLYVAHLELEADEEEEFAAIFVIGTVTDIEDDDEEPTIIELPLHEGEGFSLVF